MRALIGLCFGPLGLRRLHADCFFDNGALGGELVYRGTAELVAEPLDRFGRLDIVVANAGIRPGRRRVLEYPPRDWQQVLDVNLTGVWHTVKACVPALTRGGGGSVMVIGSGMARVSTGGSGVYAVAKAGASALPRVLVAELRECGIAVNELIPGLARTLG